MMRSNVTDCKFHYGILCCQSCGRQWHDPAPVELNITLVCCPTCRGWQRASLPEKYLVVPQDALMCPCCENTTFIASTRGLTCIDCGHTMTA